MRTWHFWSVALPFALGLTAQISIIIHQISFLKPTLGAEGAAWAVSLTSVCAVLGRLVVGSFVDRVNRRAVIAGNFLLQAMSVVLMLSAPGPVLLYVACVMFGLGVGNTTSLPSVIVQAEFPKAAFGQVVSTIIAINQFTYSFGPGLLGWLRDGFGSYEVAFAACLVLQLVAAAIILFGGARRNTAAPPAGHTRAIAGITLLPISSMERMVVAWSMRDSCASSSRWPMPSSFCTCAKRSATSSGVPATM